MCLQLFQLSKCSVKGRAIHAVGLLGRELSLKIAMIGEGFLGEKEMEMGLELFVVGFGVRRIESGILEGRQVCETVRNTGLSRAFVLRIEIDCMSNMDQIVVSFLNQMLV